ncbi:preprotein translocase subunit YajC [Viridibacillus sp. YIM B01967]|uniref:Preprotein translocase subunit YajC n=1 Tax=Viridibacillus soli TaxID=2798301 RepID=A0ABS1H205_9BACL|nr:preprotein translocase subunit YajC [Viridibacillus soli]MBK3493414.1 preprotein translocase subunit YajC [Viridibacillus soli]
MDIISGIGPIILMFGVMYLLLIRPAQKQRKKTSQMQNELSRGNKIVTIGGLHGEVDAVDDTTVIIKVSDGTKMRFERAAVGRIVESSTTSEVSLDK